MEKHAHNENRMKHAMTSTVNAHQKEVSGQGGEVGTKGKVPNEVVEAILDAWPETPQKVARKMMDRYSAYPCRNLLN